MTTLRRRWFWHWHCWICERRLWWPFPAFRICQRDHVLPEGMQ